jgi:hypothetical protein
MIREISTTWQEYVEEHESIDQSPFIFRGQSNSEKLEWRLESSFNRYYADGQLSFRTFLGQQLDEELFRITYGKYKYVEEKGLADSDVITKLYHLQHYGIPTCFIDFTYNPFTALYFAITGIKGQSGGQYNVDGFPEFYPSDCCITIFKVDYNRLKNLLTVSDLVHLNDDLFLKYDYYKREIRPYQFAHLAIDLEPARKINDKVDNYNLRSQESAFIMYDQGQLKMDLVEFISSFCRANNVTSDMPIITKYLIPYNSVFSPMHSRQSNYLTLFRFLMQKGLSGKLLFNDHQGLKYDFNFFHHMGRSSNPASSPTG